MRRFHTSGVNPSFEGLCPGKGQVGYALLTRAPVAARTLLPRAAPRLACVKPVASVHPEPGSNSSLCIFCSFFPESVMSLSCFLVIYIKGILDGSFSSLPGPLPCIARNARTRAALVLLRRYGKPFNELWCRFAERRKKYPSLMREFLSPFRRKADAKIRRLLLPTKLFNHFFHLNTKKTHFAGQNNGKTA